MQPFHTNWQTWLPPGAAALGVKHKELGLKLSLETRNSGDVIIVHCQGRVVYRDEAQTLARVVSELLGQSDKLIIDLSGVQSMDSAGIGELALLYSRAQEKGVSLKCAAANTVVRNLLDLTNLDRVIDVHPSIESALGAFSEQAICADC